MSEIKLLPCPFCDGSRFDVYDDGSAIVIVCLQCHALIEAGSKEDAVNAWNTRKLMERIIERLEELKMRYFLTIANTGNQEMDFTYEKVADALDKAIEICEEEGGIE